MPLYDVIFTKSAYKIYFKLTPKLRKGLEKCIAYLEVSPTLGPNIVKLKGLSHCYRFQIGGWRVLYEVNHPSQEVRVYEIKPRGDVYKK